MSEASNHEILKLEHINRSFGGLQAVGDVTFHVKKGEFFSLIGQNGAGKTTLLNCINNFIPVDSGQIFFNEEEITSLKPIKIMNRGIARTFQHAELFTSLSVIDNIKVGLHQYIKGNLLGQLIYFGFARRVEEKIRADIEERIIDLLCLEPYRKAPVGTLPWGIQKRVDLARALASNPKLLLVDEPTEGMTLQEREDIMRYILLVREFWDVTVVMIEHDIKAVVDVSDRVGVMNFGQLIAIGEPQAVLDDPEVQRSYFGKG
jgi:branched-chain amino acid transport system ATP-binding protein